jgi:4-hydroxy-tetrahydrodipicolinate synthase
MSLDTATAIGAARHAAGAGASSVVKEALAQLGVCGRAVRPPSPTLSEAARARIAGILAAWNPPRAEETP